MSDPLDPEQYYRRGAPSGPSLLNLLEEAESRGLVKYDDVSLDEEEEAIEEGTTHQRFEPTQLVFRGSQPSCFYTHEDGVPYRGQEMAKERLDVKIQALDPDSRLKLLLVGGAGTGKTTLARILADRLQKRWRDMGQEPGNYYELLPAQFRDKDDLDIFMRGLEPRDIVFIDEVHVFKSVVGPEAMFHTLDDSGSPRYPLGDMEGWLNVPETVSWMGATTDPGQLDNTTGEALRRRFGLELRLEAPGEETLYMILKDQETEIVDNAAWEISRRSGGLPWQAITIFEEARDFAKVRGNGIIEDEHAESAFNVLGLDKNGLLPEDRTVLRILINMDPYVTTDGRVRYKMSESAILGASNIDSKTYKTRVQPKLMRLGLLNTVGGQVLTKTALKEYAHLKEED